MTEEPKRPDRTDNPVALAIMAAVVLVLIICIASFLVLSVVNMVRGVEPPTLSPDMIATRDVIAATREAQNSDFEATSRAMFAEATATAEASQ